MDNRAIENNIVAGMCVRRATIIVTKNHKMFHFFNDIVWPNFFIDFHGIFIILIGNIFYISRAIFFNIKISGKWTIQTSWRGKDQKILRFDLHTTNSHIKILAVASILAIDLMNYFPFF